MIKKKLAIVGIVGVPATYGGFETLTDNLLDLLPEVYDVTVFCESKAYPKKLEKFKEAKLEYLNLKANGAQSVIYDSIALLKSFRKYDYVIFLGVSGAIILPFIKPFSKAKLIGHIDGLEWKRDKWGWFAKKFLKFSERLAVKYSHAVIADNKHIQDYVTEEYSEGSFLIAYGANHVNEVDSDPYKKKFSFIDKPYIFTVCRIEPENNVELHLRVFAENDIPVPYVIVGNWNSSEYGAKLYRKYSKEKNVILYNPIYEPEELNVLRSNCYFYLHGHSAGGTNPSLVEAMYLGLPILAYGVNYNRETTFNKAVYFDDYQSLKKLLISLDSLDRNEMMQTMQKLAKKNYSWKAISKQYIKMLESV
jgi:glycosyltransferase involved in cell wall biosynthesis